MKIKTNNKTRVSTQMSSVQLKLKLNLKAINRIYDVFIKFHQYLCSRTIKFAYLNKDVLDSLAGLTILVVSVS